MSDGIPLRLGLRRGDEVEVRSRQEILATLDPEARLDGLVFMPEMLRYCGQRLRVESVAHKTCDTISGSGGRRMVAAVHLEGIRCDGASHGGCQARCLVFWKEAWLKRVEAGGPARRSGGGRPKANGVPPASGCSEEAVSAATAAPAASPGGEPHYACQATELLRATSYLPWWDVRQYLRDVRSGNLTLAELAAGLYYRLTANAMRLGRGYRALLWLYARVQSRLGGPPFHRIEGRCAGSTSRDRLDLQPGETVRIKPLGEILDTLDRRRRNRGLLFDQEMAPYCGEKRRVLARVERIIDEKSGRMIRLPNDCIVLEGVVCRSRYSDRRIGCPRRIYSYWRECWLRRAEPER